MIDFKNKSIRKRSALIFAAAICACVITGVIFYAGHIHALKHPACIWLAMEYIENNTLPDGKFVYRKHANPQLTEESKKYNVLRHAGAVYAMYLCERYLKDSTLRKQRMAASNYFIEHYIRRIGNEEYAVLSKSRNEQGEEDEAATLGGVGLSLVALANLYPERLIDSRILTGLGDFILSMQKSDGNYASKYLLRANSTDTLFTSLYYPGEAALGLLYLNEVLPDTKWVLSAKRVLVYLSRKRESLGVNVEFDHWAMLATWKLFSIKNNTLSNEERALLEKHAEQMATSIIYQQDMNNTHQYYGSLQGNIRPCSIGTKMEGMIAIEQIITDERLKAQVIKSIEAMNKFLESVQIKGGIAKGGLPTSADWDTINARKNADIVQIDNVQHVLSAWILYHKFIAKDV